MLTVNSQNNDKNYNTIYRATVEFEPDSGFIKGSFYIENPADSVFILSAGLAIQSFQADLAGQYAIIPEPASGFQSFGIHTGFIPHGLKIIYSGKIKPGNYPGSVRNMNGLYEKYIELSDLIDWYPRMRNNSPFRFEMTFDVPLNYVTVASGKFIEEVRKETRSLTEWKSYCPDSRISLVSFPGMKKADVSGNENSVEIYYSALPRSYVDSMKLSLLDAINYYDKLYGAPGSSGLVRLVYSPRSAGGYARSPLILVSVTFAIDQRQSRYGMARDFRLNAHEIAHYWSRAGSSGPDDWINEGLAEYSALLASEKFIGREF